MKRLIKSGICGTHEQYIYALFTKDRSTVALKKKKKEKKGRENADAARLSAIQTYTLFIYLSFLSFLKPVQFLYLFELV